MSDSVTKSPNTCARSGSPAWSGYNNAKVSDNSYATAYSATATTAVLTATDFGFAIPAGSVIDGIKVDLERRADSNTAMYNVVDNTICLVEDSSTMIGDNKAASGYWPTTDTYATYGDSDDTWGTSLTADDINDAGFGVAVRAKINAAVAIAAYIDHIQITVYYTENSSPAVSVNVGGAWKQATDGYVNVGGIWKPISSIHTNIGGTWKQA